MGSGSGKGQGHRKTQGPRGRKDVRRRFQEEPLREVEAVEEEVRAVRGGHVRRGGLLWRNGSGDPKGEGKSGTGAGNPAPWSWHPGE